IRCRWRPCRSTGRPPRRTLRQGPRGPCARIGARGEVGRRHRQRHAGRHGQAAGHADPSGMHRAAPLDRRHRLFPARNPASARGAPQGLPHTKRRRYGHLPGRARLRTLHRHQAGRRSDEGGIRRLRPCTRDFAGRHRELQPGRKPMSLHATRRQFLIGTGIAATAIAFPALAQDKPTLRFSAVFSEQDIRAEMMKMFADSIKDDFTFEGYYGGNLFKQGTELVALQRGNLEMGNIAPQDISKQLPAWSIVTAGYLFRDAAHVKTFFASEAGAELKKMAEDELGVVVLGPTYFGVRQVGLKPDKEIKTPADMAGIKLRMPGGDAWQFLGEALGANPTPMAYAEVYTGLQT